MNSIFIPNYLSLFCEGDDAIEVQEQTAKNGSGESQHKFILKITKEKQKQEENKLLLESLKDDVKDSHISIRETEGGIQVVTSLRFLNGKLGDLFITNSSYDNTQSPGKFYVLFFIKAILYMTNYYYFVRNENDIRIQKDAFQTVFGEKANTYGKLNVIFKDMEIYLTNLGLLEFLFKYERTSGHYVFQESAFLSLFSSLERYNELKV